MTTARPRRSKGRKGSTCTLRRRHSLRWKKPRSTAEASDGQRLKPTERIPAVNGVYLPSLSPHPRKYRDEDDDDDVGCRRGCHGHLRRIPRRRLLGNKRSVRRRRLRRRLASVHRLIRFRRGDRLPRQRRCWNGSRHSDQKTNKTTDWRICLQRQRFDILSERRRSRVGVTNRDRDRNRQRGSERERENDRTRHALMRVNNSSLDLSLECRLAAELDVSVSTELVF